MNTRQPEYIKTPERLYRIEKVKNKTWNVRWYAHDAREEKISKNDGTILGLYPSKIVALAAVSLNVDAYTRKEK